MSEELSKDNKVEELAEALSEVVGEEPEKEPVEVEIKLDEEEAPVEETVGEDAVEESAEETVTEDTSTEEEKVEPEQQEVESTTEEAQDVDETPEEPKKSRKGLKIFGIVAVALVVILAGVYVGVSMRYSECFLMGTVVNGTDCSGMTIDEVGDILQKQVEEYVLTIEGANGTSEEIKGTDIGIVYNGYSQLEEAFDAQNSYTWPKALFETNEITAEIDFDYDSAKLDEKIAALECLEPENQVAAVAATVVYQDGQFVIQDETYGTQIDGAKLSEAIHASVAAIGTKVSIEEAGCYLQPRFTKESPEVIAAKDEMNKYLTATITYSLDNIVVTVDKSQTYQWISVDENMTPAISADGVKAFTKTLGNQYNTPDRGGQITTPTGKVVDVALAGYGRAVGADAEAEQLINEIKEGKTVTREPIFSRAATPEGQTIWGNTYIEVDLTAQHMWYIVEGAVALETDIVSGKKGSNDTPTGTFTILEMQKNRVLRGRPLPNGKPSYLTPVSYWMRVTWSGIGFHDAGWQPTFGGDRYLANGSHGCINMPPAMAAQLYSMIGLGTPAVIHY